MKTLITNVTAGLLLGGMGMEAPKSANPEEQQQIPYSHRLTLGKDEPCTGSKLMPVQPTKEGAEIIRKLSEQGEKLIKAPSHTTGVVLNDKNVKWLTDVTKDIPGASVKAVDENGYHHALVITGADKKEETWYVQSIGPTGFAFMGFGAYWGITLVNKADPEMIAIHEGSQIMNAKQFSQLLDNARSSGLSQKNDPAGAKAFDLTRQRPIGYVCFNGFDESDKTSRTQYYEYSRALPELLKRCGYDMVCTDDKHRITELQGMPTAQAVAGLWANPSLSGITQFAATPLETNAQLVEKQVAALHKQGVRDFYLNFLTHGDHKKGMLGFDDKWLNADELKKILVKYSDCRFAIDATGCEGGGLIGMMRDFKDAPDAPEGRISVFVHTKEEFSTLSHEYQSLLVKMLADMADGTKDAPKTYGEAHYRTDMERRRLSNGRHDPEFWKSMPGQPSLRTAHNDAAPQPLWTDKISTANEKRERC